MIKACTRCGQEKTLEEFYAAKDCLDGRRGDCKSCFKAACKARYRANPQKVRERNDRWMRTNLERYRQISAENYRENREARLAYSRAWQRDNPEAVKVRNSRWKKANPEQVRAQGRKRQALKLGYQGQHHTAMDVAVLFEQQEGLCAYCHETLVDYHVDHIVPLSRGGGNGADNICLACPPCNMSKSDRLLGSEWCVCDRAQRSTEANDYSSIGNATAGI